MKFYMTFIAAVLGVGLIIAAAPSQQKINYAQMAEDIEVMCRIIDKTMKESFKKEYQESGLFGRQGCRGFYLNRYGVVFQIDLQFPVAEKQRKVVKKKKETNLWEEYEREVRQQRSPEETEWVMEENEAYDEDKVDRLKEKLARLVGEYGARIDQLESDDMIAVVVSGRSDGVLNWKHTGSHSAGFHIAVPDIDVRVEGKLHEAEARLREAEERLAEAQERMRNAQEHQIREAQERLREAQEDLQKAREDIEKKEIKEQKIIGNGDDVGVAIGEDGVLELESEDIYADGNRIVRKQVMRGPVLPNPKLAFAYLGQPGTTMILTFNRSTLQGKTGSDWEALLREADVVQY